MSDTPIGPGSDNYGEGWFAPADQSDTDPTPTAPPSATGETLPDIEVVSAKVHEAWMESKRAQGVTSRKSEAGEELMVDYERLSEPAKELDRASVRSVYRAIASAPASPPPAGGEKTHPNAEASAMRAILGQLECNMRQKVENCCGEKADHQFCESYGCGTLKGYLDFIARGPRDLTAITAALDSAGVPEGTVGERVERACEKLRLLSEALPANDVEGATLEWYASKFEIKCGHPKFADRLRNYAAIFRGWRPDGRHVDE